MEARESLLAAGVGQPDRYAVVPPGASLRPLPTRRQARLALGLTGPGPVVAYVGQLSARRRPDRLLDVVRRLRLIVPEVRIVVCGAGERRAATVAEAVSDGLDITFLPWRSDVETVYAAADVVVLTSDEEGVPMCLIEAGLAGRPVVATDVGGVAEVVRHGTTGLLCEPYAADLTQAVADLLRNRGLRRRMGRAALAETGRRFGTPRLLAATRDLYTRLAVHRGWWSLPQVEFVPVLPTDQAILTPSGPHAYGPQL
jgi:glycosyltransferase involved in cell wall biosynthesis